METFDTNVVVRTLIKDDPEQCERAARAWRDAVARGGVFVPATVLIEVAWVLRGAGKLDRATIGSAIRHLIDSEGVTIEHDALVRRAVARFEQGPADFSDYIILESSRFAGALPVLTFDARFARDADVRLLTAGS